MALLFPTTGDSLALQLMLNKTAQAAPVIHLYNNNYTPVSGSVLGSFTETTATGYSAITTVSSSWVVSGATASYAQQTFALTSSDTIYGYYVTVGGALLYAEKFGSAATITGSGNILLTPNITGVASTTLVLPTVGLTEAMSLIVGKIASANAVLHLFSNSYSIVAGTTLANLTEVATTGYAAITLTGASWTFTSNSASYPAQVFSFSATTTVNGMYITVGGVLVWAETFASTYTFTGSGSLQVTPTITAT